MGHRAPSSIAIKKKPIASVSTPGNEASAAFTSTESKHDPNSVRRSPKRALSRWLREAPHKYATPNSSANQRFCARLKPSTSCVKKYRPRCTSTPAKLIANVLSKMRVFRLTRAALNARLGSCPYDRALRDLVNGPGAQVCLAGGAAAGHDAPVDCDGLAELGHAGARAGRRSRAAVIEQSARFAVEPVELTPVDHPHDRISIARAIGGDGRALGSGFVSAHLATPGDLGHRRLVGCDARLHQD